MSRHGATTNRSFCPDQKEDVRNGSDRGKPYQRYISSRVNIESPTRDGMAYYLVDPATGKQVSFEDCKEAGTTTTISNLKAGDLVEAKNAIYLCRVC